MLATRFEARHTTCIQQKDDAMFNSFSAVQTNRCDGRRTWSLKPQLTYRQIAQILTEEEGRSISRAEVRELCQLAESKIAHVLMTDPLVRKYCCRIDFDGTPSKRTADLLAIHP